MSTHVRYLLQLVTYELDWLSLRNNGVEVWDCKNKKILCSIPHIYEAKWCDWCPHLGGCTPAYILHTRAFGTYLLGVIYLAKKIIRWWYFTCKEPKKIRFDGILHVIIFHYFKTPCSICTFFCKIYLQWIFLSHVVSMIFAKAPPLWGRTWIILHDFMQHMDTLIQNLKIPIQLY